MRLRPSGAVLPADLVDRHLAPVLADERDPCAGLDLPDPRPPDAAGVQLTSELVDAVRGQGGEQREVLPPTHGEEVVAEVRLRCPNPVGHRQGPLLEP
jgi:hypothetical protein